MVATFENKKGIYKVGVADANTSSMEENCNFFIHQLRCLVVLKVITERNQYLIKCLIPLINMNL